MTATTSNGQPTLVIASVYSESPFNLHWFALQNAYIRRNTPGVKISFRIFLNGIESSTLGAGADIIGQSQANIGHAAGMQRVLELLRADESRAHGYLLLDSDCFPVHPTWLPVLQGLMVRHHKHFAAPIRFENLEQYPHPCAIYLDGGALDDPRLAFTATATAANLLGEPVADVGTGLLPILPDLLPLVRSNVRNRHPVAAAIYNHLFYHHGAGSREFRFRANDKYGYYAHWQLGTDLAQATTLLDELLADPDRFIASLMRP